MKPTDAAKIIGCSVSQVRTLCRNGNLPSTRKKILGGYIYDIPREAVLAYAKKPQKQGWPRGQSWEYVTE